MNVFYFCLKKILPTLSKFGLRNYLLIFFGLTDYKINSTNYIIHEIKNVFDIFFRNHFLKFLKREFCECSWIGLKDDFMVIIKLSCVKHTVT